MDLVPVAVGRSDAGPDAADDDVLEEWLLPCPFAGRWMFAQTFVARQCLDRVRREDGAEKVMVPVLATQWRVDPDRVIAKCVAALHMQGRAGQYTRADMEAWMGTGKGFEDDGFRVAWVKDSLPPDIVGVVETTRRNLDLVTAREANMVSHEDDDYAPVAVEDDRRANAIVQLAYSDAVRSCKLRAPSCVGAVTSFAVWLDLVLASNTFVDAGCGVYVTTGSDITHEPKLAYVVWETN